MTEEMKVEFLDLDAPSWEGTYTFVLTFNKQKFGGGLHVHAIGKKIDGIEISMGKAPFFTEEEAEKIHNFIVEQFQQQDAMRLESHELRK